LFVYVCVCVKSDGPKRDTERITRLLDLNLMILDIATILLSLFAIPP